MTDTVHNYIDADSNSFDYIRMICACTVFLGHFLTHFNYQSSVLNFAAYFIRGVPVFFCLSGFFCARSMDRYSRGEFIKRRFFRLYPVLWVCLAVNTAIIALTYAVKPTIKEFLLYLGTQCTVFQFYTGGWLRGYGAGAPNGALWTISTEVQFYILLVLSAGFMKKWSLKIWIAVITAFAALSIALEQIGGGQILPPLVNKLLMVSVFPFLYIFLFGAMCYWHRDRLIPLFQKYCIPLCIIYTLWNILPDSLTAGMEGIRYNAGTTVLLMMTLISIGYRAGRHRMKREWSYHFYLYHMVVINFFVHNIIRNASGIMQMLVLLTLTFSITVIAAVFSGGFIDGIVSKNIQNIVFHDK